MKKLVYFVQYIHRNPENEKKLICYRLNISQPTFYRLLIRASNIFGIQIDSTHGKYKITNYGIIDKNKM